MFIAGLGVATPPQHYSQSECWEALRVSSRFSSLLPRSRALLKKVLLGNNGIATRHLALDSLEEAFQLSPDVLHARFTRNAPLLAERSARAALDQAKMDPTKIDALLVSTCTGYLCPGLSSYVSAALGLRPDVLLLDLVGQGCGAALPSLATAAGLLASGRYQNVLSVCVEVCSAAFYLDDDPGVLISACLFGDGAAAAVCSRDASPHTRRVEWKSSTTELDAQSRDLLRFQQSGGMLRNILTPQVPELAAGAVSRSLARMLPGSLEGDRPVSTWIFHAGGRDVLLALLEKLSLSESDLCWSALALRELGNISSPFVLHVLHRAVSQGAPGGLWWMSSFGAGFTCHGALLEVD